MGGRGTQAAAALISGKVSMNSEATIDRRAKLLLFPPVFRVGFRLFFFLGPLWALIVIALWIEAMVGTITLPTAFNPLAWHRHEMLFGYLGAVIAGFLLTAIPNWTGRLPIAGWRLAGLVALWIAARLALLFSASVGSITALLLDVGFLVTLGAAAAREVLLARNRNIPVVGAILLFALAALVDHLEAMGLLATEGVGWRGGFALVLLLISLIGGRIIPSFTRNWLMKVGQKTGLPAQPSRYDLVTLVITALALVSWVAAVEPPIAAILLLAAGALQLVRMARWSGHLTVEDPLVFMLHLSYLWLPVGLLLLGQSLLVSTQPTSSALHALAAGAMGSMTLAVMTRATLGHTGRELHADNGTVAIYGLVTLGAALRVAAPWLPFDYLLMIKISGALWGGGFLLFLAFYGPKLLGKRPDGRP